MAQEKPTRRPQAETPKGFRDYFGAEVTARKAMLDKIAAVYHRYGFDPLGNIGGGNGRGAGQIPARRGPPE